MDILLICKRHYTNKDLITDKFGRLFHFPYYWSLQGHTVTVIALDYKSAKFSRQQIDGIIFYSVPFPSLLLNAAIRIFSIARSRKPAVIVASGDSYIGYFSMILAKLLNAKFVFDLYHDYRDFGSNRVPGMKYMFNQAVQGADLVACDSSILADRMSRSTPHTFLAPQGVDIELFKPMNSFEARKMLKLDMQTTYIGYTGTVDDRFDYDTVITALEKLRKDNKDIKLLMAGKINADFDFNKPYIQYLGMLPQASIPELIAACDAMIIPYKKTLLAETCNPCKLTEYIACEKPVIVSNVSDIQSYLSHPQESIYEPENADDFYAKLLQQVESPVLNTVTDEMKWESIAEDYLKNLQRLILQ